MPGGIHVPTTYAGSQPNMDSGQQNITLQAGKKPLFSFQHK